MSTKLKRRKYDREFKLDTDGNSPGTLPWISVSLKLSSILTIVPI